jgi:hypothetical protein
MAAAVLVVLLLAVLAQFASFIPARLARSHQQTPAIFNQEQI